MCVCVFCITGMPIEITVVKIRHVQIRFLVMGCFIHIKCYFTVLLYCKVGVCSNTHYKVYCGLVC